MIVLWAKVIVVKVVRIILFIYFESTVNRITDGLDVRCERKSEIKDHHKGSSLSN